jgi:hypothetical protein
MNERIRELSKQAAKFIEENSVNWVQEEFEQKFAQLIVQECAEIAHCNFHVDGLTLGGILKKHFGIKE